MRGLAPTRIKPRGMRIRRAAALVGSVVAAAALLGAGQAEAAANPSTPFRITHGNTYTDGVVTFTNRWIIVSGEQKSVSATDCRYTFAEAFDGHGEKMSGGQPSQVTCGRSEKFSFSAPADAPGGAAYAVVTLYAKSPNQNPKKLGEATVKRS